MDRSSLGRRVEKVNGHVGQSPIWKTTHTYLSYFRMYKPSAFFKHACSRDFPGLLYRTRSPEGTSKARMRRGLLIFWTIVSRNDNFLLAPPLLVPVQHPRCRESLSDTKPPEWYTIFARRPSISHWVRACTIPIGKLGGFFFVFTIASLQTVKIIVWKTWLYLWCTSSSFGWIFKQNGKYGHEWMMW